MLPPGNLLLALGAVLPLVGLRHRQPHNADASHVCRSMMLLAVIGLMVAGAFERAFL